MTQKRHAKTRKPETEKPRHLRGQEYLHNTQFVATLRGEPPGSSLLGMRLPMTVRYAGRHNLLGQVSVSTGHAEAARWAHPPGDLAPGKISASNLCAPMLMLMNPT